MVQYSKQLVNCQGIAQCLTATTRMNVSTISHHSGFEWSALQCGWHNTFE